MNEQARIETLRETGQVSEYHANRLVGNEESPVVKQAGVQAVRTVVSLREYYGYDKRPRREQQPHDWETERMEAIVDNTPIDPEQAAFARAEIDRHRIEQLRTDIARASSRQEVNYLLACERTRLERAGKVYDRESIVRDINSPFL